MSEYTTYTADVSAADDETLLEYASRYRELGLQVVPAKYPGLEPAAPSMVPGEPAKAPAWKVPFLASWRKHQHQLIDAEGFQAFTRGGRWRGDRGPTHNMGILTGECSGRLVVIDLDPVDKEGNATQAFTWWADLMRVHNSGLDLTTATQQSGRGGRHFFFRWPEGETLPTVFASALGVGRLHHGRAVPARQRQALRVGR
jgi:hypothetical protein